LKGLEAFLLEAGFDRNVVSECIEHEQKHAEAAEKTGYSIDGVRCYLAHDFIGRMSFNAEIIVNTHGKVIPPDEFQKILEAPGNPSVLDSYSIKGLKGIK
jgi:hypothetical protein